VSVCRQSHATLPDPRPCRLGSIASRKSQRVMPVDLQPTPHPTTRSISRRMSSSSSSPAAADPTTSPTTGSSSSQRRQQKQRAQNNHQLDESSGGIRATPIEVKSGGLAKPASWEVPRKLLHSSIGESDAPTLTLFPFLLKLTGRRGNQRNFCALGFCRPRRRPLSRKMSLYSTRCSRYDGSSTSEMETV
jgi:hypothetical protein